VSQAVATQERVGELVTGASSSRVTEPVAAAMAERILAGAPWLREPHYAGAVEALAVTEARLRLIDAYVADKGLWNRRGRPWAVVEYGWRLERLADNLRGSLGLTPAARARLGRNVAATEVDLAKVWSALPADPAAAAADPAAAVPADAEPVPEVPPTDPLRPSGGSQ
jgi:hypothetical protein